MTEPREKDEGRVRPGDFEIELVNGRYLDLSNPDPDVIDLEVIAHGLSNTGRYAGQTARFYSVAEHAVLVSKRLELMGQSVEVQLAGLHHDDAEAFIADISRPLKSLLPGYRELETKVRAACESALGLPFLPPSAHHAVKLADDWALACEAYKLMPSRGAGWWCEGLYDPENDPPKTSFGYRPEAAKQVFMARHRLLNRKLEGVAA